MAKINWTAEAESWLGNIHNYIAEKNPEAAIKVVFDILRRAELLEDFPEMGYKYRSEPEGDIRILLYGHYRIAYLLKPNDEIDILGVFHTAMEIDKYLE